MKRWSWAILACCAVAVVVLLLLHKETPNAVPPLWSRPGDAPVAPPSNARSSSDAQLDAQPADQAERRDALPGAVPANPAESRLRWLLRGTITGASHASCAGGVATIQPEVKAGWQRIPTVTAAIDGNGKFLADLAEIAYEQDAPGRFSKGPLHVWVDCPAGMPIDRLFSLEDARPCSLEDGTPARCIDMIFDVEAAAVVTGTVVDELGNGVQNAAVAILQAPETLKPFAEVTRARTDYAGGFRLRLHPCGPCLVVAATDDLEPAAVRTSVDALGEHPVGRLVLQPGVTLSGIVTDKVPFKMSIEAYVERTNDVRRVLFDGAPAHALAFIGDVPVVEVKWAQCGEDGAFELKGLSRTSYCLRVVGPQRGGCVAGGLSSPPCFQAPATGILFSTPGARVIFEVYQDGKPAVNANIYLGEVFGGLACPTTYDGSADCILPPERDIEVRVENPPLAARKLTVRTPRSGETIVQRVDLEGAERNATLSLSIVAGDPPEPIPYAGITVRRQMETGELGYVGGTSSYPTKGRWVIEKLPPGKVTVLVEPNGTWNRMRGMMCNETFDIELAEGRVTEHTVTIRPGGLIRVDARNAAGAPAKQRITLRDADGKQVAVSAMVDDGSTIPSLFQDTPGATPFLLVPALPEGDYELDLRGYEYDAKPVTRRIHVIAGTTVDESIEVP